MWTVVFDKRACAPPTLLPSPYGPSLWKEAHGRIFWLALIEL